MAAICTRIAILILSRPVGCFGKVLQNIKIHLSTCWYGFVVREGPDLSCKYRFVNPLVTQDFWEESTTLCKLHFSLELTITQNCQPYVLPVWRRRLERARNPIRLLGEQESNRKNTEIFEATKCAFRYASYLLFSPTWRIQAGIRKILKAFRSEEHILSCNRTMPGGWSNTCHLQQWRRVLWHSSTTNRY